MIFVDAVDDLNEETGVHKDLVETIRETLDGRQRAIHNAPRTTGSITAVVRRTTAAPVGGSSTFQDAPTPVISGLRPGGRVKSASVSYTNGALVADGRLLVFGGRSWEAGISQSCEMLDFGSHTREIVWGAGRHEPGGAELGAAEEGGEGGGAAGPLGGLARGYECDSLTLGHGSAFILARKIPGGT